MNKPIEFWIALVASSLFVFSRSDKSLPGRVLMTAISAGFGFSLTPELAAMAGRPELLTMVLVTTLFYLALEFLSALFADREILIETIKRLLKK